MGLQYCNYTLAYGQNPETFAGYFLGNQMRESIILDSNTIGMYLNALLFFFFSLVP